MVLPDSRSFKPKSLSLFVPDLRFPACPLCVSSVSFAVNSWLSRSRSMMLDAAVFVAQALLTVADFVVLCAPQWLVCLSDVGGRRALHAPHYPSPTHPRMA
jgi:hypothetical protein